MALLINAVIWISRIIYLYSALLVIYALLSWFPGAYDTKLGRLLTRLCEPYLSMFSNLRLHIGPIDFTILVAIMLLEFANRGLIIIVNQIIRIVLGG